MTAPDDEAKAEHYRQLWLDAEAVIERTIDQRDDAERAIVAMVRRRDDRSAMWLAIGVLLGVLTMGVM